MDSRIAANRRLWNEWARINQESEFYDMVGFRAGQTSLKPIELEEVGDVAGKSLLHLQCHFGQDTVSWARLGAKVTGIDLSEKALKVAQLHLLESRLAVDYENVSVEDYAAAHAGKFDAVTCMELLEHVPEPGAMAAACARLVRPGGQVFFSTINRNPKSYLFAVVGAEYVLGLLPKGTHDYLRFIKPSELSRWSRDAGLRTDELIGMSYNPITRRYWLGRDCDVNYLLRTTRNA